MQKLSNEKSFRIDDEHPLIRKTRLLPTSSFSSSLFLDLAAPELASPAAGDVNRQTLGSRLARVTTEQEKMIKENGE